MAVVAPVLVTLLFGIIEYGWVFTVKQAVTSAAREGCRLATLQGSTNTEVQATVQSYLDAFGLTPADYALTITRGTDVDPTERVSLVIAYEQISLLGGFFGDTSWTIGSTCTMRTEGVD